MLYPLSPDFVIEFDTNFGYGASSYFYLILTYKGLDIIPFSQWILYRCAGWKEIIRYSQAYDLQNYYWLTAMEYAQEAYNLSITDEQVFISRYIIGECEKMVNGLESMLINDKFKKYSLGGIYSEEVYLKGHDLVEFRGEKISGALSFISKILEFEKIGSFKNFINRIEICNKKIQPVLENEIVEITKELVPLVSEMTPLEIKYQESLSRYSSYSKEREELVHSLIKENGEHYKYWYLPDNEFKEQHPGYKTFNELFVEQHPEYPIFFNTYSEVCKKYFELSSIINLLKTTQENIVKYNRAIEKYFVELSL